MLRLGQTPPRSPFSERTPCGGAFLAERPGKLSLDFEPPGRRRGDKTLRDGDTGIGVMPSASAWQVVGQARVTLVRTFSTFSST